MDVAFVYPGYESLGIEMLSAVLKRAGHRTKLIFEPALFDDPYIRLSPLDRWTSFRSETVQKVRALDPDLLCFSVTTFLYPWALATAAAIREVSDAPIVFGGIHPTVAPEECLRHPQVDYVVRGEGEHPLLELVSALGDGAPSADRLRAIPSLGFRDGGQVHMNGLAPLWDGLDGLPAPDKEIYYEEHPLFRLGYNTFAQRGCPERCSFCYKTAVRRIYDAPKYEWRRSPQHVVEEIESNRGRADIHFVRFIDDNFTTDPAWLKEFAPLYRERIGVPFWTQVHPNTITPLTARLLNEAGCVDVQMGVQSLNDEIRKGTFQRTESIRRIERAIELLSQAEVKVAVDHILSVPGQTEQELRDTVRFYVEHPVARINVFWLAYLPGTDHTEKARESGEIDEGQYRRIHDGSESISVLSGGHRFERANARFQTLLMLSAVLPKRWLAFVMRHRLERWLPYPGAMLSTVVTYWLSYEKRGSRNDLYRVWTRLRYRDYLLRKLTRRGVRPEQLVWSEPEGRRADVAAAA